LMKWAAWPVAASRAASRRSALRSLPAVTTEISSTAIRQCSQRLTNSSSHSWTISVKGRRRWLASTTRPSRRSSQTSRGYSLVHPRRNRATLSTVVALD
jgi:hypothetical protein